PLPAARRGTAARSRCHSRSADHTPCWWRGTDRSPPGLLGRRSGIGGGEPGNAAVPVAADFIAGRMVAGAAAADLLRRSWPPSGCPWESERGCSPWASTGRGSVSRPVDLRPRRHLMTVAARLMAAEARLHKL